MPDVSVGEAAQALQVSAQTVRRMCDDGALKCWRTGGGHRRIPTGEVDRVRKERGALNADRQPAALYIRVPSDLDPALRQHLGLVVSSQLMVAAVQAGYNASRDYVLIDDTAAETPLSERPLFKRLLDSILAHSIQAVFCTRWDDLLLDGWPVLEMVAKSCGVEIIQIGVDVIDDPAILRKRNMAAWMRRSTR